MSAAVGAGPGAQVAPVVDAPAAGLQILDLGAAGRALGLQLLERELLRRRHQLAFGSGVDHRRPGDGRGLLRRQFPPAGGGSGLGQGRQALGGAQHVVGLTHGRAGLLRQALRRAARPGASPGGTVCGSGRGQRLDGGGHLLDGRRVAHHPVGGGGGDESGVEAGGEALHRLS